MRSLLPLLLLLLTACSTGSRQQQALQLYHQGLDCVDRHDAPQALRLYQQARDLQPDDSLMALLCSQTGSIFFDQGLMERSFSAYQEAYAYDLRRGDTLGMVYDLRDMGNVVRTQEPDDSCQVYFERALQLAAALGDTLMQLDVQSQLAAYHLFHHDYTATRRLLMPVLTQTGDQPETGLLFMAADYYRQTGQTDSAVYYYEQLLQSGSADACLSAHRALADICFERGQTAEAVSHLRLFETYTDSVLSQHTAEAVSRVAALYDYTQREQENHELRLQNDRSRHLIGLGASAIIILLLTILAIHLYHSRRQLVYNMKLEKLEQLLAQSKAGSQASSPTPQQPSPNPQQPSPISQLAIVQRLQQQMSTQTPANDDDWQELETAVNQVYPGFSTRLRQFCNGTPHEQHVCLLLKAGFSPINIAELTAHTRQSVSNTRARLYEKTFGRKGTPADWDDFIRSL